MSAGAAPKEQLPLTLDQKQTVTALGSAAQTVAVLLFVLAAVQIIGGALAWWFWGLALFSALLMVIQGLLTKLLGLVMLAVSSDFKYFSRFPQYGGNHLRNAAKNLTFFYKVMTGLAVVIGIVALVRWLV
jgi:hypothetical protein